MQLRKRMWAGALALGACAGPTVIAAPCDHKAVPQVNGGAVVVAFERVAAGEDLKPSQLVYTAGGKTYVVEESYCKK